MKDPKGLLMKDTICLLVKDPKCLSVKNPRVSKSRIFSYLSEGFKRSLSERSKCSDSEGSNYYKKVI